MKKIIMGSFCIFLGTLTFLVTNSKEGLEFVHYPAVIFIILYGCYLNYKGIKELNTKKKIKLNNLLKNL